MTMGTAFSPDESTIQRALQSAPPDSPSFCDILDKALSLSGLTMTEVAQLMAVDHPDDVARICETAARIKDRIYGKRIVLFAPLYISNLCRNECVYCAFRASNREMERRALTLPEIQEETTALLKEGHKRVLLVAGESYPREGFSYVLSAIRTVYDTRYRDSAIRRINVNIAPLSVDEFRQLKETDIGTYQLFQETYHRTTYRAVHLRGPKSDYDFRVTALDRAIEAGIDDVGIGVLFGLYDWRFELLSILQHAVHLEDRFGVGPHTISVPRLEPASGSPLSAAPPHPVTDDAFRRIIAILRLAVPYTGIILSTRENPDMRRESFSLGVSQISAGSRTNIGGYSSRENPDASQFSLGDHRRLDEVIRDVASMGYCPSFCTACYRSGRTGADFMDLARPGEIREHCDPNAVSSFKEYLMDYGAIETRTAGETLIEHLVTEMDEKPQALTRKMLEQVGKGKKDVFR